MTRTQIETVSDPSTLIPTLWLGTSLGSVLTVSITLPDADIRNTSPVLVSILGEYEHKSTEENSFLSTLSNHHLLSANVTRIGQE